MAAGEDEGFPSLSAGPTATNGLIYVRFDSRAQQRSLRARFRTLVSGHLSGESCSVADDCASRYCVDGTCCKTACDQGCGQCGGGGGGPKGICEPLPAKDVCGQTNRYVCPGESLVCPVGCTDSSVCAPGLSCVGGQCAPFGTVCIDELTAQTETGPFSCGSYRCLNGACAGTCASVDDCAPGNVCDFAGRCGPAPVVENPAGGCSVAFSSPRGGWLACAVAAAFMVARRRRRKKVSEQPGDPVLGRPH